MHVRHWTFEIVRQLQADGVAGAEAKRRARIRSVVGELAHSLTWHWSRVEFDVEQTVDAHQDRRFAPRVGPGARSGRCRRRFPLRLGMSAPYESAGAASQRAEAESRDTRACDLSPGETATNVAS